MNDQKIIYTLEPLPYAYDALEPYIDARTMEIHHTKHQQAYIDNLNKALANHPDLQQQPLPDLLKNLAAIPEPVREAIRNNGGGEFNHAMFWTFMKPNGGGEPKGNIGKEIIARFGSFAAFKEQFSTAAKSRFGSGWAWLSMDMQGDISIHSLANQDTPVSNGMVPLLGLDVWEHAYYLKYQNRRVDYIDAWWHVINWDQVEQRFNQVRL